MSFVQEGGSGLYQDFLELGGDTGYYKALPSSLPLPLPPTCLWAMYRLPTWKKTGLNDTQLKS